MPPLKEQAAEACKTLQSLRGGRIMAMERDLAVMWAMFRGCSDAYAAQQTGLSASTVYRTRRRFEYNPWLLFRVPILHRVSWLESHCGVVRHAMRGCKSLNGKHVSMWPATSFPRCHYRSTE